MDLQTARAGPRGDAVTCSQNAATLGGLQLSDTSRPEAEQDDLAWSRADWRLANRGWSECEIALLDCEPAVGDLRWCSRFRALGVPSVAGRHVEPVVFLPNDQFEFARDARDASGAVVAVVFSAPDDLGNPLDLAAWEPETGRLALWLGRVSMLGQDNLYGWRLRSASATSIGSPNRQSPTRTRTSCMTGDGRRSSARSRRRSTLSFSWRIIAKGTLHMAPLINPSDRIGHLGHPYRPAKQTPSA